MKKTCKVCGCDAIDLLFSINKYWCMKCKKLYDYKLKKGQKSIHNKGLVGE